MSFEEFVQQCREEIEGFHAYWLREQKANPKAFPTEMGEGDWFEQFMAYLSLLGH